MYKSAVIVFLLVNLLLIGNCFGQDSKVKSKVKKESYKSLYSRSSADKASLLLKEADELKLTSPGEALNKVEEALAMSLPRKMILVRVNVTCCSEKSTKALRSGNWRWKIIIAPIKS